MVSEHADWLTDIESDDEQRVIRALHRACPCNKSAVLYEEFMPLLHRMAKDERPRVRAVALHLQEDAMTELARQDELANGFVRNRPGGSGRRREARRADRRQGFSG